MKAIIGLLGGLPNARGRRDDDFGDRLNYRYTVSILVTFAIIVTTKQFVGDRITCWAPAHFDGSWESYANDYCWVKNTYYLPFDEYIPKEHEQEKRDEGKVIFYQWVPIILLFQAFLFYAPCSIWRSLNERSGIDVDSVVRAGLVFHAADKVDDRESTLGYLVRQMHRFLTMRRDKNIGCNLSLSYFITKFCCPKCGRRHGNYLITLYLFCKCLYIINAIGQLFMLNHLLGQDFSLYGFHAIGLWRHGEDLATSQRFPRVTMCDFKVRFVPGNVQRYTLQCVLPINLFHEKVFLIVWFWLVFIASYNIMSMLSWLLRSIFRIDQHRFVKRHMRLADKKLIRSAKGKKESDAENTRRKNEKKIFNRFVDKHLGSDGVFVLRILQTNTDDIATADITGALWDDYRDMVRKEQNEDIEPTTSPKMAESGF